MKSQSVVLRFFGLSRTDWFNQLVPILNRDCDDYSAQLDQAELVLKLNRPANDLVHRLTVKFKDQLVGFGSSNNLEQVVGNQLIRHQISVTSAESLTSGMFQSLLGNVAGISQIFPGGFVTYSNHSKHQLLSVPSQVISHYGVVSKDTAIWMASQARKIMQTDLAVSFTGVAGPSRLENQPAGTVWIGLAKANHAPKAKLHHLVDWSRKLAGFEFHSASRNLIRLLSAKIGLKMISDVINNKDSN